MQDHNLLMEVEGEVSVHQVSPDDYFWNINNERRFLLKKLPTPELSLLIAMVMED